MSPFSCCYTIRVAALVHLYYPSYSSFLSCAVMLPPPDAFATFFIPCSPHCRHYTVSPPPADLLPLCGIYPFKLILSIHLSGVIRDAEEPSVCLCLNLLDQNYCSYRNLHADFQMFVYTNCDSSSLILSFQKIYFTNACTPSSRKIFFASIFYCTVKGRFP